MEMGGKFHAPATLPSGRAPPRAGVDDFVKQEMYYPCLESNTAPSSQ